MATSDLQPVGEKVSFADYFKSDPAEEGGEIPPLLDAYRCFLKSCYVQPISIQNDDATGAAVGAAGDNAESVAPADMFGAVLEQEDKEERNAVWAKVCDIRKATVTLIAPPAVAGGRYGHRSLNAMFEASKMKDVPQSSKGKKTRMLRVKKSKFKRKRDAYSYCLPMFSQPSCLR